MGFKTRLWCFTNYKLDFDYKNYYKTSTAEYIAYSLEVCPTTNREHHQGYVYFQGPRGSKKGVAKDLGSCHVEPCRGNIDQNQDYCMKESEMTILGTKPNQGERKDLNLLKDKILTGEITAEDVCCDDPNMYHHYGRTLNKLEDIALRKKFRTKMTKGIWYWGKTGCGKSHIAFNDYTPDTHFTLNINDGGFWDGYTGQKIVIINEFRGQIPFGELLDLVDKWPKTVKRKGIPPVPFLAEKLIITAPCDPEETYSGVCDKSLWNTNDGALDQILRRFETVHLEQKWSEGNTGTSDPKPVVEKKPKNLNILELIESLQE